MKFLVTFQDSKNIDLLIEAGVDGFVFQNDLITPRPTSSMELEQMTKVIIYCKKNDKIVYLQLTLMMHEMHIDAVRDFLIWAKDNTIDGILFADVGVYQLAKEVGVEHLLIYQPGTLTTNTFDGTFWQNLGIKGVFVAREITKKDILRFDNQSFLIGMIGHGYLNMFHSRRPLISNFMKYQEEEPLPLRQTNLTLIEEKRNESYKVVENEQGTHIFRSMPMQSFGQVKELSTVLDIFMVEGLFESDEVIASIVKDYKSVLKNADLLESVLEKYENSHDTGFLFKETVYNEF